MSTYTTTLGLYILNLLSVPTWLKITGLFHSYDILINEA
jgi:hypothetical protein